jgi:hypothetical protein
MRNRLVHECNDVNLNIVWDVVQFEIPPLIEELKSHIPLEPQGKRGDAIAAAQYIDGADCQEIISGHQK